MLVPLGNRTDTYRHGVLNFLLPLFAVENRPGGGGGSGAPLDTGKGFGEETGAWGAEEPAKMGGVSGPGLAR